MYRKATRLVLICYRIWAYGHMGYEAIYSKYMVMENHPIANAIYMIDTKSPTASSHVDYYSIYDSCLCDKKMGIMHVMWYLICIRIHIMILRDYGCVYEYRETYNSCSTGIDVVAHRLSVCQTTY